MTANSGTIDITELVEQMRQAFVTWSVRLIISTVASVPWLSWLALPVIKPLFEFLLTNIFEVLSKAAEMQAFFLSTAMRKAAQAKDFVEAVNAKNSLPPSASFEEYENAEKKQMAAFRNFVMVTQ